MKLLCVVVAYLGVDGVIMYLTLRVVPCHVELILVVDGASEASIVLVYIRFGVFRMLAGTNRACRICSRRSCHTPGKRHCIRTCDRCVSRWGTWP